MDHTSFGLRIREARLRLGMPQRELAGYLGVSVAFIGYLEHGQRSVSMEHLYGICRKLNISSDYLLGLEQVPQNIKPSTLCVLHAIEEAAQYVKKA